MKSSTKCFIAAGCLVAVGVTLIILGWTVLAEERMIGRVPNFAAFVPGMFLTAMSLPLWFLGLFPRIAKLGAGLQNETMDIASDDISTALDRTAGAASSAIKSVASSIAQGLKEAGDSVIYCKRCGNSIPADSAFCKHCGTKQ